MLISYKLGQGSIILRVKILDSSVATGAGKTGLTSASSGLIISTIANNEATATAYTVAAGNVETITTLGTYAAPTASKCRFKEVDATNHKGVYEIHIADARYAVSSAKSLLVSISGATDAAECDALIPLTQVDPYDSVRAGLTSLPNAAADAAGGLPISDAGGLDVDAILTDIANVQTSVNLLPTAVHTGTARSGGINSLRLAAGASSNGIAYRGMRIVLLTGAGAGSEGVIISYTGGTDQTATIAITWNNGTPDATTTYAIFPASVNLSSWLWEQPGAVTSGGVPLNAITLRAIIGLASGNLDDQLDGIQTVLGTPTDTDLATDIAAIPTLAEILAGGDVDGYSLEETLKLCLAALAGKLSGASGTTVTIRSADDSADRIVATVDANGNRTAVILDASG